MEEKKVKIDLAPADYYVLEIALEKAKELLDNGSLHGDNLILYESFKALRKRISAALTNYYRITESDSD